ncbi:MAG: cytochrome c1 [Alphaproteobacteria bacterium]
MKHILILALALFASTVHASEGAHVAQQGWGFHGLATHWDKDQLYRGYTVFTNVCMSCHSAKYISHRDLMKAHFTEAEAKALASALNMKLDDKLKTGLADADAQELYGKIPPDLSLINKARAGLADYTYAVLMGYSQDPEAIHHAFPEGVPQGAYFNTAFPGNAIAMPNPLGSADLVTYHDQTPATVENMAKDVTYFLQWTAEPELLARKALGVYVLLFVGIFVVLTYLVKRAYWKGVKHE